jgi:hypothetical protein
MTRCIGRRKFFAEKQATEKCVLEDKIERAEFNQVLSEIGSSSLQDHDRRRRVAARPLLKQ